jgi:hypothetical protein
MRNGSVVVITLGLLVILAGLIPGCNKGLGPITEPTGFSGVITYKNWQAAQVLELRIVAFEEIPTDSAGLLAVALRALGDPGGVSNLQVALYPPFGLPVATVLKILGNRGNGIADTVDYSFLKEGTWLKERTYKYVIVAWRYGPGVFTDWRPAGVFTSTPGSFEPASVIVRANRLRTDVNISVDFQNLPPLPWRQ